MSEATRGAAPGGVLERLVTVMRRLLAPGGCPWDQAQTLESLRGYLLEEAHEVVEAIDRGSPADLQEELGDLLMQIVFQAELAERRGWFTLEQVVGGISDKLERRHPHVFGDGPMADGHAPGSQQGWEQLKRKEKGGRGTLAGLPRSLPALLRAVRLGEKAAGVGFDWPDRHGARAKVDEELAELDEAVAADDRAAVEGELGDVLFALSSLARKLRVDPESALRGALDRFTDRFGHAEAAARRAGTELAALDPSALDRLWQAAKRARG